VFHHVLGVSLLCRGKEDHACRSVEELARVDLDLEPREFVVLFAGLEVLEVVDKQLCDALLFAGQEDPFDAFGIGGSSDIRAFSIQCFFDPFVNVGNVVAAEEVLFLRHA
jgi:hypothetical protein